MEILAFLLLLGAALLVALPLLQRGRVQRRVERRLASLWGGAAPETRQHLAEELRAAALRLGDAVLGQGAARRKLARKLAEAGFGSREAPQLFAAGRLAFCLGAGLLAALLAPLGDPLRDGAFVAAVGFLLPGLLLQGRATRRARMTRAELPVVIDVLTMAMESGAAVEQAVRFVVQLPTSPAPVTLPALRGFVTDLDRATPYELSLARLDDRLGIEEAGLLVEVLRQHMVHGTELLVPLRAIARDLREQRVMRARAAIGKATTQMTVVMITCLLPALLALLGAPAVSSVVATLGRAG